MVRALSDVGAIRFKSLHFYLAIKDVGQSALTKRNDKQASLMWTD